MFTTRPEPDDVGVVLNGKEFRYWSEIEISDSMDSFSTVDFTAPFEPERKEFRETFRPFSFLPLVVTLGGQPMFTGRLLGVHPRAESNTSTVEVNAYALAGVLEDCNAPANTVPNEFKKVGFTAIATKLLQPFGIKVQVRGGEGAKFDRVKLDQERKIADFLTELAKQRNFVMTNTPDGHVLCWKSVQTGNPVARLNGRESPVSSVSASFSPQDYFSEITGWARSRRARGGAKYTAKNKWLQGVLRPMSFQLDDTEKGGAPEATMAKLGRMFANMASYSIDNIPTWRDPKGNVWTPNTTILLTAPSVMVYRETELLIRRVKLKQQANSKTASLELCLPGCFSAEVPKVLPWDD